MKDIQYQQKAIKKLTDMVVDLIDIDELRQKVVFKAPTGSGKTYMTAMAMDAIADTLKNDVRHRYERVAFVWIAPNRLHCQAYDSLSKLFAETRSLNPIMFDSIADGKLNHADVLCLNWGSIHNEDNILVRDTENSNSLWDIIEATKCDKTAIVAIIDEEHLHWDARADRAATVLAKLKPIVEVRVSATPKTITHNCVVVHRKEVVQAQMIKDGIVINPDLVVKESQEVEDYLIDEALKKRDLLAKCYAEMGKNINPLLLIQLPNDNATLSSEDKTMRDQVVNYLKTKYAIFTESGEMAIWLSDKADKQNLDGIEKPDSQVKVLLFKEAIAKGWDCPRASVLLIFRKLQSNEFAIQTLGRILRMPEQKYYFNPLLNKGYVYTNLSRDRIVVAGESEDYWKQNIITANRRKNIQNITLPSVYELYAASDRNRLGTDFAQFLYEFMKKHWLNSGAVQASLFGIEDDGTMIMSSSFPGMDEDINANRQALERKQKIRFNVNGVIITIPKDLNIQNEESEIRVDDTLEYTRSSGKIYKIFMEYCQSLLTKYEKAASTPLLAAAIFDVMERLFELSECETTRVVLSVRPLNNNEKFTDLFSRALDEYYPRVAKRKEDAKERSFTPCTWEVPKIRMYNADKNEEVAEAQNHALKPYVQTKRELHQERNFVKFLESHSASIDWWYKNGDEGRMHYAVEYQHPKYGKKLFYVDFIIRLKNGDIYLFDTKNEGFANDLEDEKVLVAKHNALHNYVVNSKNSHLKVGSLIKWVSNAWRYTQFNITSVDPTGWSSFHPDQLI